MSDICRINEADYGIEGFQYVVEIKSGERICFGSSVIRDTAPIGNNLSPFQKRLTTENFKTGPGYYNSDKITSTIHQGLNKVRSTKGVGPLGSNDIRFKNKCYMRVPSPGRYNNEFKWDTKQSAVPFCLKSKKIQPDPANPGPATYDLNKVWKCRRTRFKHNLGKPTMINAVETFCIPNPTNTCSKCSTICKNDYWHKDYNIYLCQFCWDEEKRTREIYQPKELSLFKKIRDCSFIHQHEGVKSAITTLPHNKLMKKMQLENYLDLYMRC